MSTASHLAPAQFRAAQGRHPWRAAAREGLARRPAAGHRRRRHRQDHHHRASRGATGAQRRRPRAHAAADLHAPRRHRDAAPCTRHRARGAQRHARQQGAGSCCSGWSGPAPSTRSATACCATMRATCSSSRASPSSTAPTPPICSMSIRAAARPGREGAALSAQGHLPGDLLVARQHAEEPDRSARAAVSVVQGLGRGSAQAVSRLRRAQAALRAARLRRSAALLAPDDGRAAAGAGRRRQFRSRAGRRIPGHQQTAG